MQLPRSAAAVALDGSRTRCRRSKTRASATGGPRQMHESHAARAGYQLLDVAPLFAVLTKKYRNLSVAGL